MSDSFTCSGKGACGCTLPLSAFYKNKTKRGHDNICKECFQARNNTHDRSLQPQPSYEVKKRSLKKHIEKRREWEREYNKRPERKAKRREYLAANPHLTQAWHAIRRMREGVDMTEDDKAISKEYRKAIMNDPCFYCKQRAEVMHTDHMFPLSKGGTDHWWNLARACEHCNESKLARCVTKFLLLTTDVCEVRTA